MNNTIDVVIYSYKGKKLKDTVVNLKEMLSGENDIKIYVADQHPLDRSEMFKSLGVSYYTHIFWDSLRSPCAIKNQAIRNSKAEYVLQLGDSVVLTKDWDKKLLDFIKDKEIVISGNHSVKLSIDGLFYISVSKEECENFGHQVENRVFRLAFIFIYFSNTASIKEIASLGMTWFILMFCIFLKCGIAPLYI